MNADRRLAIAVGLDVFVVVLFVAIGRRNHEEGSALADVVETAAPFLIGLAVGWAALRIWRHPVRVSSAVALWPITVLVGMLARRVIFDRGTATSFVVVATIFLGLCLIGWRAAWRAIAARTKRQSSVPARMSR